MKWKGFKRRSILAGLFFLIMWCIVCCGNSETEEDVTFLFVQEAGSGTFALSEDDTYTLTLKDVKPFTIYFSDRPATIAGSVPMEEFIENFDWDESNPPNAAVTLLEADESQDVIIVQLFDPHYDSDAGTLTYATRILEDYTGVSLSRHIEMADEMIPSEFTVVSLFIDDCPDFCAECRSGNGDYCGDVFVGACYGWVELRCIPCHSPSGCCNSKYPNCCENSCSNVTYRC